jgi:3-oxoacyl-[acyl-carrier protein] reductase
MRRMNHTDRVAIVTGSTQGLGRAMAEALLAGGARVLVCGRRGELAQEVARELDPTGTRALGCPLDVGERASFAQAIALVRERWGRLDILVNNAGMTVSRSFWEIDDAEWDEIMRVNLRSVLIGCQLAGAVMRAQGWGRIVNHASLAGQQGGLVAGAHYAASKAGIVVLTKIAARELAPSGVTVNAISPAAVWSTPMESMGAERLAELERSIPVGRVGRPEEVAALVSFLASEEAGYVTGATYDINGGVFMR